MENFISKWRSKKAKERIAGAHDPVEGAVTEAGGPLSARLSIHVAGFIAAVLLGFPIKKAMQNAAYRRLIRKLQTGGRHAAPEDKAE